MVFNDVLAAQAMNAALSMGVKLPSELSLIGFDNEPLCETLTPSLSTVSPDFRQIGATAVDLLNAGASRCGSGAGRKLLTPVRLVARESVAEL